MNSLTLALTAHIVAKGKGGTNGGNMLTDVLTLMSKFAIIGGGIWLAWGAIVVGTSLKDHNGPGIQSGVWQCVGGGMIIAAAALFKSIAV